jgi:hypothetical protein
MPPVRHAYWRHQEYLDVRRRLKDRWCGQGTQNEAFSSGFAGKAIELMIGE